MTNQKQVTRTKLYFICNPMGKKPYHEIPIVQNEGTNPNFGNSQRVFPDGKLDFNNPCFREPSSPLETMLGLFSPLNPSRCDEFAHIERAHLFCLPRGKHVDGTYLLNCRNNPGMLKLCLSYLELPPLKERIDSIIGSICHSIRCNGLKDYIAESSGTYEKDRKLYEEVGIFAKGIVDRHKDMMWKKVSDSVTDNPDNPNNYYEIMSDGQIYGLGVALELFAREIPYQSGNRVVMKDPKDFLETCMYFLERGIGTNRGVGKGLFKEVRQQQIPA